MLPTTQRAIPLRARNDVVAERIEYRGEGTWVLKDPVALKYHRLLPEQYCVLRSLDGVKSLEGIRDEVHRSHPTRTFTLREIQNVVTDLHRKNLVLSDRPGQADILLDQAREERNRRWIGMFQNLLYLRLPGWDPETTLAWLYPLVRFMFRPPVVALCTLFVVSSWILLGIHFDAFRRALPEFHQFFSWPNLMYLWITLAAAKIVHEFGHGLTCKHFGGECHEMGMMLLVFSPCLYCDVTDSWMLKNKWKRIAIAAAGMYVEVILSAAAVWTWWMTSSGLLHHLCLNVFFVTTVTTVIFNANPLMRFDGYYMMSDWLEIPNLRPKANRLLREWFAWYCLGIESPPDPFLPQTGRVWFMLFAIAAGVYRWVVFFGIMIFLYVMLKPYGLQSVGIALAAVSLAGLAYSMGRTVYGIVTAPRAEPMSKRKIVISLILVSAAVSAALMVPLPLHVESPFLVEPQEAKHVFVVTPGRLVEVYVEPGDYVTRGTTLARLENVDKEDELRKLELELEIQRDRVRRFSALEDQPQLELAGVQLKNVEEELAELELQLAQLILVAPADGWVVAPAYKEQPPPTAPGEPLNRWYGTPLEERNRGCYLDAGDELLIVAGRPVDEGDALAADEVVSTSENGKFVYKAVILVDQADRNDVAVGQPLELRFAHLPRRSYFSEVSEISERHLEFAPPALTANGGGTLPAVPDSQGRARLVSHVFQVTAELNDDFPLLRTGMKGRARFLVERRSAAMWIWRYLRQTFHFRL